MIALKSIYEIVLQLLAFAGLLPPPPSPCLAARAAPDRARPGRARRIRERDLEIGARAHVVEVGFVRPLVEGHLGAADGHFVQGILPWTILLVPSPAGACPRARLRRDPGGRPRLLQGILPWTIPFSRAGA